MRLTPDQTARRWLLAERWWDADDANMTLCETDPVAWLVRFGEDVLRYCAGEGTIRRLTDDGTPPEPRS